MTVKRLKLGRRGEEVACKYLEGLGYKIIEKNFRGRLGELDLIAEEDDVLVFIEVKTRSSNALGSPLEGIDRRKQRQVIRAAEEYLLLRDLAERACRFDGVGVLIDRTGRVSVELVRGAFEAGG